MSHALSKLPDALASQFTDVTDLRMENCHKEARRGAPPAAPQGAVADVLALSERQAKEGVVKAGWVQFTSLPAARVLTWPALVCRPGLVARLRALPGLPYISVAFALKAGEEEACIRQALAELDGKLAAQSSRVREILEKDSGGAVAINALGTSEDGAEYIRVNDLTWCLRGADNTLPRDPLRTISLQDLAGVPGYLDCQHEIRVVDFITGSPFLLVEFEVSGGLSYLAWYNLGTACRATKNAVLAAAEKTGHDIDSGRGFDAPGQGFLEVMADTLQGASTAGLPVASAQAG